MKTYIDILLLLGLSVLVSCGGSHSDEPRPVGPEQPVTPGDEEHAMGFRASSSPMSRGGSPLENTHKLFKVWGYKHTSASSNTLQNVFPGYQVKYFDLGWHYDGDSNPSQSELSGQFLKYWDASASDYVFYGYAPLELPAGITLSEDPETGFTITGVPTHTASTDQSDIVVAKQTRRFRDDLGVWALEDKDALVNQPNEQQPSVFYDPVPMVFHHLLSKVEYRICNIGTKENVEITNLTVKFDEGVTFNTEGSYANGDWGDFTNSSRYLLNLNLTSSPVVLEAVPDKSQSTLLATFYEIPQILAKNLTVSVEVDGRVIPKDGLDSGELWQYDKIYIYYIILKVDDGDLNPIYVDLEVEDFVNGGDLTNETQTNW